MTINLADNTPRVSYAVAEGVTQTSFTVSFEFFDDADLNVYVDGVLKTLTTDYTVTGGDGSTGSVSISVIGAAGGSTVVITRDIDLKRTTDFPASGAFQVGSLNTELDKLIAIAADLDDKASRALQLTDFDSAVSLVLPDVDTRKGKTLAFNASTGAVESGPSISDVQTVSAAAADIATLADIEDGTDATDAIQTVAGISSNVSTVAGISSNVTTVAGNTSNINAVAADATDIGTVATNIANVNTVAGIDSNVTTVAGISSDVTAVAADATDIGAVAAKATEIGRLGTADAVSDLNTLGTADAVSDMNTLAAISTDITSVADISSDVTTAASNISDIQNASTNAATATTKAAEAATSASNAATSESNASTSESNAAASAAAAAASFDAFDDIYLGAKASAPTQDNDGDALTNGDLYFDTGDNELYIWNGSAWQAASPNIVADTTPQLGGDLDTNGNDINFGDNDKAVFGAGSDLQVYHDGTNSYIYENGTGSLRVRATEFDVQQLSNGNSVIKSDGSSAQLLENGSLKLETTSSGIDVTGTVTADGLTVDTDAYRRLLLTYPDAFTSKLQIGFSNFYVQGSGTTDELTIANNSSGQTKFINQSKTSLLIDNSNDVALYADDGTTQGLFWDASTQRLGLGTTSPDTNLQVNQTGTAGNNYDLGSIKIGDTVGIEVGFNNIGSGRASFTSLNNAGTTNNRISFGFGAITSGGEPTKNVMTLNQSGDVGIGTSSPSAPLHVNSGTANTVAFFESTDGNANLFIIDSNGSARISCESLTGSGGTNGSFVIGTGGASDGTGTNDAVTIDSSGNVGIGTSSPNNKLIVDGAMGITSAASAAISEGLLIDYSTNLARFLTYDSSTGSEIAFYTQPSGGSTTERLRIDSSGRFGVAKIPDSSIGTVGFEASAAGQILMTTSGADVLFVNRKNNDGSLIRLFQDGSEEGSISVSGTTVSYNGGHLARWSQLADNTKDISIVKGTVMTNLDQMAEWTKDGVTEDNEQLNCMAVSSVEGDANVAGVFVNWDDDDEDYTADMNIAMTGDMVIRIASGTTVARGDLLMSAGDGTAKPQGDDIVRSKTIAKVTSTNVSHTYDDGSYLVPCVLMAC